MAGTPMMRQWARIKQAHPGCVVLFRLGDFYEAFAEDAGKLADVCDVTLTSRPVSKGERVPMAGVPYYAVDGYIAQLVRAGVRVAIVEQSGAETSPEKRARMSRRTTAAPGGPEPAVRGLMDREVVRVVTPGTLVEGDLLDARANNYLAAVVRRGAVVGLAYADVTTGEFRTTQIEDDDDARRVIDELVRLRPAEVIVPEDAGAPGRAGDALASILRDRFDVLGIGAVVAPVPAWHFDADNARRVILDQFRARTLASYGCDDKPLATGAAGAILAYLRETQQGAVAQVAGLSTYSTEQFMVLDASTRRNLELVTTIRGDTRRGTLLSVLDDTQTAMGGRQLRRWLDQPLVDRPRIERRLDAVEALAREGLLRAEVRAALKGMPDIERLANRVVAGYAGPREVQALARGLRVVPRLRAMLLGARDLPTALAGLCSQDVTALAGRIEATLADEPPAVLGVPGVIRTGYSGDLDGIHASVAAARAWIAGLESVERERTGIRKLKVGFNKVFGYYLSVPKAQIGLVPDDYHRKQTTVDGERYITPELKERESEVLHAEERIVALERDLFLDLVGEVAAAAPLLLEAARDAGVLDTLACLAETAVRRGYRRPALDDGRDLVIRGGRHPVVEHMRPEVPFVPNDLTLAAGEVVLLTGPNMAGKSTVGRQAALIVLLAQIGSFVPAEEVRLGIVDRIFTRIGAQDELAAGQSTFMVEMVETAGILHHATPRSLIILDELGRGTSTYDGMSIAWAVIEHIHNHPRLGARTLFATHYHELTALADLLPRVRNINMAVAETPDGIVFLHRVEPGAADRSYGIHVAELAGLPRDVTGRAWKILGRLEAEGNVPLQRAEGRPPVESSGQLPLFTPIEREHPVVAALRTLDLNAMTPLEALTRLYELRREAGDAPRGGP
jgi:DNA mismatch repair protein MutS